MIQNPLALACVLLAIEIAVIYLSEDKLFKPFFKFLPAVFWIYFLPMVCSTLGVIPSQSDLYQKISAYLLPASLFLLLISVDVPAILKLGRSALLMMLAGSVGVMIGAPIILLLFGRVLPPDAWSGFSALSGSWIGGSANMIAVKEILKTPESIFVPMIAVDIVVSYSWMAILIALAACQNVYDRWNRSDRRLLDELHERVSDLSTVSFKGYDAGVLVLMFLLAAVMTVLSTQFAKQLPEMRGITAFTWTILVITVLGILLSFTRARRLESYGSSKAGYLFLYFVLASIGAKANLSSLSTAPLLIAAGFVWVVFHFLFLLAVGRLIRAPLALAATASQANIGGAVSAPIVAAIYQPVLAPVGLLLGVSGTIIGTYAALLCAQLCYWVTHSRFF
ncbi:MAG: DUF819 family protein [Candidatus Omnitrophica bacterium]|nr:DUF819 family protein [Candidatus Omnitrophota bacterium]